MFFSIVGLCLGAVIVFCTASMLSFPPEKIMLFVINSLAGAVILLAFQTYLASEGINMAIAPIGAVGVGILGVFGALAAIVIALII